jgi:solute carrier family 25 (adenine nucleotide translocator) protein 4/5/6/31
MKCLPQTCFYLLISSSFVALLLFYFLTSWGRYLCNIHTGGTTTTVLYPIQYLRTRLAMDMGATPEARKYPRGMRDVFCGTLKTDGVKGLYQGYGLALFGVVVYRALHLGGYDVMKSELLHRLESNNSDTESDSIELSMAQRFVLAQTVSVIAAVVCYPMDSVKRRLMMQACTPITERQYRHTLDCFQKVFRREGVRGFYLGFGPNLVRSVGNAMLLVGYDTVKSLIY